MYSNIQTEILGVIKKQSRNYPVTIKELEEHFECSNSLIHRHIKKLEGGELIEAKRVAKPKGGLTYYKAPDVEWPRYLGKKCFNCHNKSTISICIFHEELADMEIIIKPERVGVKLTENTVACEYFMERKTHWNRKRLEEFLDQIRRFTKTDNGFKISYHCVKCGTELSTLGSGLVAKLGSSVLRCEDCDSFYKILFDYKKKVFKVHYNKEIGLEYKRKFLEVTKESDPEKLYSSESLGIVIPDLQLSKFNFRTRTLTVSNWVGKLEELNYLVAKKEEDYRYLEELLEAKGYKKISLILGMDKLVSPVPTKQQIGLLKLLRVIMIINKEFCIAMLISRITIIEKIHELFKGEKEALVKRAKAEIKRIIEEVKRKSWITPKEWNKFEMRGGKEMWKVIAIYLESLGIFFPGRGKSRLVNDPSTPHRLFFAYSAIDTLINGVYGKGGEFVKRYCSDIGFCWNGLPGFCHGKTRGGVFGLHLDLREQEKILVLPNLVEAIKEGKIDPKEVQYLRGRKREKIFYINPESDLEDQLNEVKEEALSGKINERLARNVIREYYLHGKQWINDLLRRSYDYEVRHHGVEYQPWAIINMKVWGMMGGKEREQLINYLRKEQRKIGFKPLTVLEIN